MTKHKLGIGNPINKKPFFYNNAKFCNQKNNFYKINLLVDSIKSKENFSVSKLSSDLICESIYSKCLLETLRKVGQVETYSGEKMQGLMMTFATLEKDIQINILGKSEVITLDKEDDDKISCFNAFIRIQDIMGYIAQKEDVELDHLLTSHVDNLMATVIDISKMIVCENNPTAVSFCFDTGFSDQEDQTEQFSYSMTYTEFPNGKCIKSTYKLLDTDTLGEQFDNIQKSVDLATNSHKKIMRIPVDVNQYITDVLKKKVDENSFNVFNDHSMIQNVDILENDDINSIYNDLFDVNTNKHEELNNFSFYLYEYADLKIHDSLREKNPKQDILDILNNL